MKALLTPSISLALVAPVPAQGELDPPGAPAPTMKSLDQVEPRTDVTTLDGDNDTAHIIDESGSYYLSSSLTFEKHTCIEIRASGVTLDLEGFTISSGGGVEAITIDGGDLNNIFLRNGHLVGQFESGISTEDSPENVMVSRVSVLDSTISGINLGTSRTTSVDHCMVRNLGSTAIRAGTVKHSVGTGGSIGIRASGNVAHSTGIGESGSGIHAGGNVSHSTGTSRPDENSFDGLPDVGIEAGGNVSHSTGTSEGPEGIDEGIVAGGNVLGSIGEAESGDGIDSSGTVSRSQGTTNSDDAVGIRCQIAIGCTFEGGADIDHAYDMPQP